MKAYPHRPILHWKYPYKRILYLLISFGVFTACTEGPEQKTVDSSLKPEASRFTQKVIAEGLEEPLQLDFDQQGQLYWIERVGIIKRLRESEDQIEILGTVALADQPAPGLIGILLDKDFEKTRHLYLYFSAAADLGSKMRLSRFTIGEDQKILLESEVVLLSIPWEQPDGHHFGGGMTWDKEGNLYLSVGGDSEPTQYAPLAFKNEGGRGQDEGRTSGNTNDWRGTILRIHPQPDGSYTIPQGNLFPVGTLKTLPEIYVMGNRNPWRLSIDSETGFLHWGEVGPDAGVDSEEFGPMGYDEFNVAKEAGNFGWPYVIGKNLPYARYDYTTKTYGDPYDPAALINDSPNNTGLVDLPPAQPALISYPYRVSEEWPIFGSAARSAVGGPIFRRADFSKEAARVFPDYFEGKWLITDYVRNWIMVVSMNEARTEVNAIERFLPADLMIHSQPLDMDFSPNGDLYLIEYGIKGKGRISRIEYNAGNRAPIAKAGSQSKSGIVPFKVQLTSEGTVDDDGDKLNYEWSVLSKDGGQAQKFDAANPEVILEKPGIYVVVLTVKDSDGAFDSTSFEIIAGNNQPSVNIEITAGNRTFYFPNQSVQYKVNVNDHEDGSTEKGEIPAEEIFVTAEYIPDVMEVDQLDVLKSEGKLGSETVIRHLNAKTLIAQNNCMACHLVEGPLVGPSFLDIAQKYEGKKDAYQNLSKSIMEGSSGKWGNTPMPPHPMLTPAETNQLIDYVLELSDAGKERPKLLPEGNFKTDAIQSKGNGGRVASFFPTPYQIGSYVMHASYTDKGSSEVTGLQLKGDDFVLLRYPLLAPENADFKSAEGISFTPSTNDPGFIFTGKGGYIGFKNIDLTGINLINIGAINRFWHWSHFIGATIELRLGSLDGKLVGEPYLVPPAPKGEKGPFFGKAMGSPVPVDVSQIRGMHDLYVIVHQATAKESDALLIMTGIEFKQ